MRKLLFLLGIAAIIFAAFFVYYKQESQRSLVASATPTPSESLIPIPSGTVLPTKFTQTSWKTYTTDYLGVTFSYPPDPRLRSAPEGLGTPAPGPVEDKKNQLVEILYAYGYLFRITKKVTSQSLEKWVPQNDSNLAYHNANEYRTTFAGLPAILSIETPDFVESTQVPENIYYVKPNSDTLYEIEYAIPVPPDKNETIEEKQMDEYIPQILGSVKFL